MRMSSTYGSSMPAEVDATRRALRNASIQFEDIVDRDGDGVVSYEEFSELMLPPDDGLRTSAGDGPREWYARLCTRAEGTVRLDDFFYYIFEVVSVAHGASIFQLFRALDAKSDGLLDEFEFVDFITWLGFGPCATDIFLAHATRAEQLVSLLELAQVLRARAAASTHAERRAILAVAEAHTTYRPPAPIDTSGWRLQCSDAAALGVEIGKLVELSGARPSDLFRFLDRNESGFLTRFDFDAALSQMGVEAVGNSALAEDLDVDGGTTYRQKLAVRLYSMLADGSRRGVGFHTFRRWLRGSLRASTSETIATICVERAELDEGEWSEGRLRTMVRELLASRHLRALDLIRTWTVDRNVCLTKKEWVKGAASPPRARVSSPSPTPSTPSRRLPRPPAAPAAVTARPPTPQASRPSSSSRPTTRSGTSRLSRS